MTKPTIHHIVDGQPVCGKAGIGYQDYNKVLSNGNGCKECLTRENQMDRRISDQDIEALKTQCLKLKMVAGRRRTFKGRKEIGEVVRNMEVILNKFVK